MPASYKICEFAAHAGAVNCLKIGRKSHGVLATGGEDRKVNLWAIGRSAAILSLAGHQSPIECVTYDFEEAYVAAGGQNGTVKMYDLQAARVTRTLTGHRASCVALAFHRDGQFLISGSQDTNAKVWDLRQRDCIRTIKGHGRAVRQLALSPDSQMLATGCEGGEIKLWDFATGKLLAEFKGHAGHAVSGLQFHPHEFVLASSSADRTVRLWDLETWQPLGAVGPEAQPMRGLAFHPGGGHLLAASQDGFKVWATEPLAQCDSVGVDWGKVSDIAISEHHLIGCAMAGSSVSTFSVDLRSVAPWGSRPVEAAGLAVAGAGSRRVSRQPSSTSLGTAPAQQLQPPQQQRPGQLSRPVSGRAGFAAPQPPAPAPAPLPAEAAAPPCLETVGPLRQQLARQRTPPHAMERQRTPPGELQAPAAAGMVARVKAVSAATDVQGDSLLRGQLAQTHASTGTEVQGESLLRGQLPLQLRQEARGPPLTATPAGALPEGSPGSGIGGGGRPPRALGALTTTSSSGSYFPEVVPVLLPSNAPAPLLSGGSSRTGSGGASYTGGVSGSGADALPAGVAAAHASGSVNTSRGSSRECTPPSSSRGAQDPEHRPPWNAAPVLPPCPIPAAGLRAQQGQVQQQPLMHHHHHHHQQQQQQPTCDTAAAAGVDPLLAAAAARPHMVGELSALLGALQVARSFVARGSIEAAYRSVVVHGDAGAATMLLAALKGRQAAFELPSVEALARLELLLISGREEHVGAALDALALVLRGPGQVIRDTLAQPPPSIGIDLHSEERRERAAVAKLALQGLGMRLSVAGRVHEGMVGARAVQLAAELQALG